MRRYVVLGVNENPKYLYYIPIVKWAWSKFGWDTLVFYHAYHMYAARIQTPIEQLVFKVTDWVYGLQNISGYKSETLAQVSRMYAACRSNGFLMTSDADMIPLSNYWHSLEDKSEENILCYGRNLSKEHQPICYVGASAYHWAKMMNIHGRDCEYFMRRDLDKMDKKTNAWLWDQDLLTNKLEKYSVKKTYYNREINPITGYPAGRVDRSSWSLNHRQLIDCHAPHDILTNEKSFHKVMELLHHVWPGEDFKWFVSYHKEFKKLL